MREIVVEKASLCHAVLDGCWQRRYYLDMQSGAIACVTEAVRHQLQDVYDMHGEADAEPHLLTDDLLQAHLIEMDDDRFWKVVEVKSAEIDQWRDDFSSTVEPALQRLLWQALDHNDKVGFERILGMESAELSRWQTVKQTHLWSVALQWLAQADVRLIAASPP